MQFSTLLIDSCFSHPNGFLTNSTLDSYNKLIFNYLLQIEYSNQFETIINIFNKLNSNNTFNFQLENLFKDFVCHSLPLDDPNTYNQIKNHVLNIIPLLETEESLNSNIILNGSNNTSLNLIPESLLVEKDIFANSTTRTRSMLQYTIPDGKLFYPEPFLASPCYMHSDISFLHILQY